MSLQVLVVHTGERVVVDRASLVNLDTLKTWISDTVAVPVTKQILLSTSGKQAKFPQLKAEVLFGSLRRAATDTTDSY